MGKHPAAKVSHSPKTMKTKVKKKTTIMKAMKAMKSVKAVKAMKAMKDLKAMKTQVKKKTTIMKAMKAMKDMKAMKTQVQRSSKKPPAMKDQRTKSTKNISAVIKATKTMKAPKAMKAVKAAGAKKGNAKVAVGRWAKWRVYVGWKEKTVGRLKKQNLKTNRRGRVVYKKMSDQAKERMKTSKISTWYQSVKEARQVLNLVGFVPVGGKTAAGQALLKQTKMIYYERVYSISQKATEAMLQLMRSPSPSPTSPTVAGRAAAASVSPELVELTSQPGTAEGRPAVLSSPELVELTSQPGSAKGRMAAMLSSPEAEKVSKGEMEGRQRKDDVLGGQEAA